MPVVHPVANWTATEFAKLRAEVKAGNVLEGYVPSTVVNRFKTESS